MPEIINLTTFEPITDMHQSNQDGVTCMFVYKRDGKGNPIDFDIKQYFSEAKPDAKV